MSHANSTPRFGVLAHRDFRLFFAARAISSIGSEVAMLGLPLALLVAGTSPGVVGLVLAAQIIPLLGFTLLGGVAGDRWPRRRLMIGADLLRCATQGGIALILALGHPNLLLLLTLTAGIGIGDAVFGPASTGLITQITPADHLQSANGLVSTTGSAAIVAGPVIAGLLVGFGGGPLALALDSVTYLLSALCLLFVAAPALATLASGSDTAPIRSSSATARASFRADMAQGWTEFKRHRWLQILTAQISLQNMLAMSLFFILGPALYAHKDNGPQLWGMVTAGVGIGGLVGGIALTGLKPRRPFFVLEIGIVAMTVPLICLGLGAPVILMLGASTLFGAGMVVTNVLFDTAIQENVPDEYLSRVSSFVHLTVNALMPVGFILSGPAAALFGAPVILLCGAGLLQMTVMAAALTPAIRNFVKGSGKAGTDEADATQSEPMATTPHGFAPEELDRGSSA